MINIEKLEAERKQLELLIDGEKLLQYMATHIDLETGKIPIEHARAVILSWLKAHSQGRIY